jgi:hypothetical protein
MNNKIIGLVVVLVACAAAAVAAVPMMLPSHASRTPTGALDFTVSGTSDCLRFLNGSVPTIYVSFTIAANENWQLTINATKMPGGANGWTDVYVYEGYWDNGTNHMCRAQNLYPIMNEIKSADFAIRANATYTQTFSATTMQSYTVFFVVPPGGQATFHVTLKPT